MLLRRLIAVLLLTVSGLPMLASAMSLGQAPENGLPACCRRTGAHHCAMTMGERAQMTVADAQPTTPRFQAPMDCCPYCPAAPVVSHFDSFGTPVEITAVLLAFQSQPAVIAQTESRWRVARERSRQKRGPPQHLRN